MKSRVLVLAMIFFEIKTTHSQIISFPNETSYLRLVSNDKRLLLFQGQRGHHQNEENIYKQQEKTGRLWDKIFIKLSGGQGFFTPGSYTVSSISEVNWITPPFNFHDTTIKTQSKKGIGGGSKFGFGIGFIQNDFINFGIDFDFNRGQKLSNTLTIIIDQENYSRVVDGMSYSAATITPHVIFKALARPKFFIYNKVGLLLTLPFTLHTYEQAERGSTVRVGPNTIFLDSIIYPNSYYTYIHVDSTSYTNNYKIRLGIGLNVAFGINFKLTDRLRIFGEVFGNYSALSPSVSTGNTYDKQLDMETVDSTNFHYQKPPKKTITQTNNYTTYRHGGAVNINSYVNQDLGNTPDGYDQQINTAIINSHKFTINMAVIGINIGVIWRF